MNEYVCVNVIGGTRITIEGEDLISAGMGVLALMYDLTEEWEVDKVTRYSEDDAIMITGSNQETGSRLMTLLIRKEKFDEDAKLYEKYKDVGR